MRRVMELIDKRMVDFRTAPFFEFLRDTSIGPRERLAFAPSVGHYVMSVTDLYKLVFREEPPRDELQRLINAETREDEFHWQWFLKDLEKLGASPSIPFSDALRFVWSDATVQMRLLTYHMCRLGFGATSLRKFVLIQVIEATGKVAIANIAEVGREFGVATGERLVYLGPHHVEAESEHTLEAPDVQQWIDAIELDAHQVQELSALVEETFGYFRAFIDEMHACATSGSTIGRSSAAATASSVAAQT